jgi:elongation factor P
LANTYATNEFRSGLKVLLDSDPCVLIDCEFVKPGKGQTFARIRYRNLKTGRVLDKTFKSGEKVEAADVMDTEMEFLYSDGGEWHFMDPNTYEQYAAGRAVLDGQEKWLLQGMNCGVTLYNDAILLVHPPHFVDLKVVETEPGIRGDTATGGSKNATLETGTVVRVPLFIEAGEALRLDTRSGEYVSRVRN